MAYESISHTSGVYIFVLSKQEEHLFSTLPAILLQNKLCAYDKYMKRAELWVKKLTYLLISWFPLSFRSQMILTFILQGGILIHY